MLFSEMSDYAIYQDEEGRLRAVKRGFTTLGFFFTWIWALFKRLYGISISIFAVVLLSGIIIPSKPFHFAIQVAVMIAVGTQGNEWIEEKLKTKGHRFKKLIYCESQREAPLRYSEGIALNHVER